MKLYEVLQLLESSKTTGCSAKVFYVDSCRDVKEWLVDSIRYEPLCSNWKIFSFNYVSYSRFISDVYASKQEAYIKLSEILKAKSDVALRRAETEE